jgi:hypothetical protein
LYVHPVPDRTYVRQPNKGGSAGETRGAYVRIQQVPVCVIPVLRTVSFARSLARIARQPPAVARYSSSPGYDRKDRQTHIRLHNIISSMRCVRGQRAESAMGGEPAPAPDCVCVVPTHANKLYSTSDRMGRVGT